jgi:hypothetical protein
LSGMMISSKRRPPGMWTKTIGEVATPTGIYKRHRNRE